MGPFCRFIRSIFAGMKRAHCSHLFAPIFLPASGVLAPSETEKYHQKTPEISLYFTF
jgi:hypothetical protein